MHACQCRDAVRCHQHRPVPVIIWWWTCLLLVPIAAHRVSSLSLNHVRHGSTTSSSTSSPTTSSTTSTTAHHYPESRLPIYVRNNGGEIFRELISANVHDNYINIDFEETDGSQITELVDFHNDVRIIRINRLGEEDLNEQRVLTFCFVTRLPANEFISADAVSNLRQDIVFSETLLDFNRVRELTVRMNYLLAFVSLLAFVHLGRAGVCYSLAKLGRVDINGIYIEGDSIVVIKWPGYITVPFTRLNESGPTTANLQMYDLVLNANYKFIPWPHRLRPSYQKSKPHQGGPKQGNVHQISYFQDPEYKSIGYIVTQKDDPSKYEHIYRIADINMERMAQLTKLGALNPYSFMGVVNGKDKYEGFWMANDHSDLGDVQVYVPLNDMFSWKMKPTYFYFLSDYGYYVNTAMEGDKYIPLTYNQAFDIYAHKKRPVNIFQDKFLMGFRVWDPTTRIFRVYFFENTLQHVVVLQNTPKVISRWTYHNIPYKHFFNCKPLVEPDEFDADLITTQPTKPTTRPTTRPTTKLTTKHTTKPTAKPTTKPTIKKTEKPIAQPITKVITIKPTSVSKAAEKKFTNRELILILLVVVLILVIIIWILCARRRRGTRRHRKTRHLSYTDDPPPRRPSSGNNHIAYASPRRPASDVNNMTSFAVSGAASSLASQHSANSGLHAHKRNHKAHSPARALAGQASVRSTDKDHFRSPSVATNLKMNTRAATVRSNTTVNPSQTMKF